MGRTKDYDDYIDWAFDNGIDPADFNTFDDYSDFVVAKFPPQNFDSWGRHSKIKLQSELTDFFKESRTIPATKKITAKVILKKAKIREQSRKNREANGFRSKAIRLVNRISHKNVKQGKKSIATKTTLRNIDTIRDKRVSGAKLTKSERKTQRGLIPTRAGELRRFINAKTGEKYTQKEAMERAHLEHGGV